MRSKASIGSNLSSAGSQPSGPAEVLGPWEEIHPAFAEGKGPVSEATLLMAKHLVPGSARDLLDADW
eukprot:8550932-Alexandrium_andersonii.AAC.1